MYSFNIFFVHDFIGMCTGIVRKCVQEDFIGKCTILDRKCTRAEEGSGPIRPNRPSPPGSPPQNLAGDGRQQEGVFRHAE